jgi:hypothetical protein
LNKHRGPARAILNDNFLVIYINAGGGEY